MPKLLVLDKNRFQGIPFVLLREFVKSYYVVVPYVLCVECLISKDSVSLDLLSRIQKLIRAGAYYGYSPLKLAEQEKKTLSPIDSIIDQNGTNAFLTSILHDDRNYIEGEAETYWQIVMPIVKKLLELGEVFYANILKKNLLKDIRTEENDKMSRLIKWTQAMDPLWDEFLKRIDPDISLHIKPTWYTWHNIRLRFILGLEWAYQKAKSGCFPNLNDASHDFHDMQYVAYLSQADGLLTRDEVLVKPLARAAFPDKAVFACIEDVPREYRLQ